MKTPSTLKLVTLVFLALLLFSGVSTARQVHQNARSDQQIHDFFKALSPYGTWVNHRTYGKVWYPRGVDENWRPYSDGHWAHTEQYGWLWVENEVWGWAPFHYGRWAWDKWYGWIWVPGNTWAPAWVMWRSGGGYAAWAPMPPSVIWQPNVGIDNRYFINDRDMFIGSWIAVREYDLPNRYLSRHILTPRHTIQIFHSTHYVSNYITIVNRTIVNKGVPIRHIEKAIGQPVTPVKPIVVHDLVPPSTATKPHERDIPTIIQPIAITAEHADTDKEIELAKKINSARPDQATPSPTTEVIEPRLPGRLTGEPEPRSGQAVVPSTTTDATSLTPAQLTEQPQVNTRSIPVTLDTAIANAVTSDSTPIDVPRMIQSDPNLPCPSETECIQQPGQIAVPNEVIIPSASVPETPVQNPITSMPSSIDTRSVNTEIQPAAINPEPVNAAINAAPSDNSIHQLDNNPVYVQPHMPVEIQQPALNETRPEANPVYQPETPVQFESSLPSSNNMQINTPEPTYPEPSSSLVYTIPSESNAGQFDSGASSLQTPSPIEPQQSAPIQMNPEPAPAMSAPEPAPIYQPEPPPAPTPTPEPTPAPAQDVPQPTSEPEKK